MTDVAWILGQAGERMVALTGWIGTHPDDGGDYAFVLAHPTGHGAADKMRRLADILGLVRADAGQTPQVPPDTTWTKIGPSDDGTAIWVHYGDAAWLHRPIPADHEATITSRGEVMLLVGTDPWHGTTERDLDRYLSRAHRLFLGRVRTMT